MTERKSPWMTREETATYLLWSVRSVDRHLITSKQYTPGKMRRDIRGSGPRHRVRIWAEDVYAMLPLLAQSA